MNDLLTIVRWVIALPVFILENILKAITLVLVALSLIVMAVLFPIFRKTWNNFNDSKFYLYGTKWKGNFPLTLKVWDSWSLIGMERS